MFPGNGDQPVSGSFSSPLGIPVALYTVSLSRHKAGRKQNIEDGEHPPPTRTGHATNTSMPCLHEAHHNTTACLLQERSQLVVLHIDCPALIWEIGVGQSHNGPPSVLRSSIGAYGVQLLVHTQAREGSSFTQAHQCTPLLPLTWYLNWELAPTAATMVLKHRAFVSCSTNTRVVTQAPRQYDPQARRLDREHNATFLKEDDVLAVLFPPCLCESTLQQQTMHVSMPMRFGQQAIPAVSRVGDPRHATALLSTQTDFRPTQQPTLPACRLWLQPNQPCCWPTLVRVFASEAPPALTTVVTSQRSCSQVACMQRARVERPNLSPLHAKVVVRLQQRQRSVVCGVRCHDGQRNNPVGGRGRMLCTTAHSGEAAGPSLHVQR